MAKKISKKKPSRVAKQATKKNSRSPSGRAVASGGAKIVAANGDIWPIERDVLFRPDRFKYVRKIIKPAGCVFCDPAVKEPTFETLCAYQTQHSMVVLNKFPYNSGHLLVLPRRHCGDLLQLSDVEYVDLMATVKVAMKAAQEIYLPSGMNMGLNHGAVAGAGIPEHLHFHLIPRWAGDLNFFPLIAESKVVIESLEQTWNRYREYFVKLEASR